MQPWWGEPWSLQGSGILLRQYEWRFLSSSKNELDKSDVIMSLECKLLCVWMCVCAESGLPIQRCHVTRWVPLRCAPCFSKGGPSVSTAVGWFIITNHRKQGKCTFNICLHIMILYCFLFEQVVKYTCLCYLLKNICPKLFIQRDRISVLEM